MKRLYVYLMMGTLVLAWIGIGSEYAEAAAYAMVPRISNGKKKFK